MSAKGGNRLSLAATIGQKRTVSSHCKIHSEYGSKEDNMTLSRGDTVRLIDVDQSSTVLSDWLSARAPASGDVAFVEETWDSKDGRTVRLLCEPRAGFLEWRATFREAELVYEVLSTDLGDAAP